MNSLKVCGMFKEYLCAAKNIRKIPSANAVIHVTHGAKKLKRDRKYKRPEDLVDPLYYGKGPKKEVQDSLQAIADRGFAREMPSYQPPTDLDQQLHKICKKVFGSEMSSTWKEQSLNDPLIKFKVLTKCSESFKKDVPSASLHKMKTVEDVFTYYNTPVDGCLPYNAMVRDSKSLPPNLSIMPDTPPFNPTTDSFFDGVTAFPGRKRVIYTKYGEKFEKVIEWPNI